MSDLLDLSVGTVVEIFNTSEWDQPSDDARVADLPTFPFLPEDISTHDYHIINPY